MIHDLPKLLIIQSSDFKFRFVLANLYYKKEEKKVKRYFTNQ